MRWCGKKKKSAVMLRSVALQYMFQHLSVTQTQLKAVKEIVHLKWKLSVFSPLCHVTYDKYGTKMEKYCVSPPLQLQWMGTGA